jgi:hypothetical protein
VIGDAQAYLRRDRASGGVALAWRLAGLVGHGTVTICAQHWKHQGPTPRLHSNSPR